MISLSQIQTSVLRKMSHDGANTKTRAQLITDLNHQGIFSAHPDGSHYGIGEYIQSEEETHTRAVMDTVPMYVPLDVKQRSNSITLNESKLYTDASYDILMTTHLRVAHNIYFGNTNLHDELWDKRKILGDIRDETALLKSNLVEYTELFETDHLDVPVSNKLGSFHELIVSPSSVRFEKPVFKCTRVDEIVNIFIEFLITEIHTNIIEITLPYEMRATYVPFQVILRPNDMSGEFSGMARAYGKNSNILYVESHLFINSLYVSIEGTYLTTFDKPYQNKQIKWITPARYNRLKLMHLSDVRLLSEVPRSDLGFSDGYGYETRTLNRVDLTLRFVFRQRTTQHVPEIRFVAEFPVLNDSVYGTHVNGYADCHLPEHRVYTTKPPQVVIRGKNRLEVYVKIGSLYFHEAVIHAQVSYYSADETKRVHPFEKPVIRSSGTLNNSEITITNIRMYDAIHNDTYRLLNQYNVLLSQNNHANDYDTYSNVPLQLTLHFDLEDQVLEVSNIDLFNQTDQYNRRYLYPRRKMFYMKLSVHNFVHEYDGPYDLLPDFTQYI